MPPPVIAAPLASEPLRRRQLVVTRRRATLLLAVVAAVFIASVVWGGDATWAGYVQATAAASMVGGLADWFAVVALFRRPLGLPIPHTAIIVERKDQFAATLGDFIQSSFLTPAAITERVNAAEPVARLAVWLGDRGNAERVADEALDAAVAVVGLLRDDDVHRVIEGLVRQRADRIAVAPLAGRVLEALTLQRRHEELLDRLLRGLNHYLLEHHDELRQQLMGESRGWLRDVVEHKIFEHVLDGLMTLLREMEHDHDHPLRRDLLSRLVGFAEELRTSPELLAQGERLKRDLLQRPEVQQWAAEVWVDLKAQLHGAAADPTSDLHRHVADAVVAAGRRLEQDPVLRTRLEQALEALVAHATERSKGSIAALVSTTISRWDAEETASRLELLLGPDLQWVRINGTVVGGLAGLLLHGVTVALG